MKKLLKREKIKNLYGDTSSLSGDCSRLFGNCSGLSGDCTGLSGDLKKCEIDHLVITAISDLVEDTVAK
jgi:hypothetical protein